MSIYEIKTKTLERKAPLFKKLKYQPCILIKTRRPEAFPPGKEGYKGLPCLGKLNTSTDHKTKQTPAWLSLLTELVIYGTLVLHGPCSSELQRVFAAMPCSCWQEA